MSQYPMPSEFTNQSMFEPFPESRSSQPKGFQVKPEQQSEGGAIANPEVIPPETLQF
jgi:hypothetical protein